MECRLLATPQAAFAEVLTRQPLVLGIGEVHATSASGKITPAIRRFNATLLPLLRRRASDLIVETWITQGECGETEKQAVEQIQAATDRPPETEDDIVNLLRRTRDLGISPHVLELTCAQYRSLQAQDGELDEERLLGLVKQLLLEKAKHLFERNEERNSSRTVVIYGGALHNAVAPPPDLAAYSYGEALDLETAGRYIELDLFVPELIEHDEEAQREPWFPYFQRHVSPRKTLLIRVRPETYLLIFPRSQALKR